MSESIPLEGESVLVKERSLFKMTVSQLTQLLRSEDLEKLAELGGVDGVAKALNSDLKTGLTKTEIETNFESRKSVYVTQLSPKFNCIVMEVTFFLKHLETLGFKNSGLHCKMRHYSF